MADRLQRIRRSEEKPPVKKPHAIAIVGNSGAGKTTLLERLIPALKRKGLRVGGSSTTRTGSTSIIRGRTATGSPRRGPKR